VLSNVRGTQQPRNRLPPSLVSDVIFEVLPRVGAALLGVEYVKSLVLHTEILQETE